MAVRPTPKSGESLRRRLAPARILVAEDEFLIAVQIEADLQSAGFLTVGPFTTLELATHASRRESFDLALLDINLNGRMVYPLAGELTARGLPLVFLTGYLTKDMPERFRALPRLSKPYQVTTLVETIRGVLPGVGQ